MKYSKNYKLNEYNLVFYDDLSALQITINAFLN